MARRQPPPLAERLQTAREAAQLKQDEFALIIGVSTATVSRWERGSTEPNISELLRVAKATGCSVNWLATGYHQDDHQDDPEEDELPGVLQEFLGTPIGKIARERGLTLKLRHLQTDAPPSIALYEALTIALVSTLAATTTPQPAVTTRRRVRSKA